MDKIQKRPIYRYKENLRKIAPTEVLDLPHCYYEYTRFLSECADREDFNHISVYASSYRDRNYSVTQEFHNVESKKRR